jgi:glycosyltransferase involved in cell wall biosynthesis
VVDPLVSIVIPAFNSERTIEQCLQSVKDQTYPNIEVLVIDNCSTDSTVEIAEGFNANVLCRRCERSEAKNYGATRAQGFFVFFLDSDQELTPNVVRKCVTVCLSESADAVIIPEESVANGFLSECRKIEKDLHMKDELLEAPRFFRRAIFQEIGGYDAKLGFGEDSDLYGRITEEGFRTRRVSARIMHNEGELSMKRIVVKAYYYGRSFPTFAKKNPSLARKKHFPVPTKYLPNIRALPRDPIHFIGLILMKTVEYEAYIIGIIEHSVHRDKS